MNEQPELALSIAKRIAFCAGHRLLHHEGKCGNLHGHNYVAEFHVAGRQVDELGRVVDFGIVKQLFKSWIDDNWDHGVILWREDSEAIHALEALEPSRVFVLPWNPTAENLARYLLEVVGPELLDRVRGYQLRLIRVRVWETDDSSAEAAVPVTDRGADEAAVPAWQQVFAG
jgi:6-pyruvoyltetrahydropterin/6-carboxytetrahydropterin synthase